MDEDSDPLSRVPLRAASRVVTQADPDTPGCKERFVDGRNPDRIFIPATLEDNQAP
jgi:hypothetical protein